LRRPAKRVAAPTLSIDNFRGLRFIHSDTELSSSFFGTGSRNPKKLNHARVSIPQQSPFTDQQREWLEKHWAIGYPRKPQLRLATLGYLKLSSRWWSLQRLPALCFLKAAEPRLQRKHMFRGNALLPSLTKELLHELRLFFPSTISSDLTR